MTHKKITIMVLLSSFVISCGFHLRGSQDLSGVLPEVQIQGVDKFSDLGRELSRALIAAKTNVMDESNTILEITQNNVTKRVLSLDAAGRANQYELSYQLTFSLLEKIKGESIKSGNKQNIDSQQIFNLIPTQTITTKREYIFDSNLVLAKADEENKLKNDMRNAAVLKLIRRLMFTLKKISLKNKKLPEHNTK